ncbi:MAG: S8 family serine peptidase, partial [Lewinella sp.]|nr:S8 family serine peptidase [Lewinella sp.]
KSTDRFVIRQLPRQLTDRGYVLHDQISSHSTLVRTDPQELDRLMDIVRTEAIAHHLYFWPGTENEVLLTDRVLIRFQPAATDEQINELIARYALLVLRTYPNGEILCQLSNQTDMNPAKLVCCLMEDEQELVAMADMDLNFRMKPQAVPDDPSYERHWHLHTRMIHPEVSPLASTYCETAWQLLGSYGNSEVVIGVADDGCDMRHRDFDSVAKFAGWGAFSGSQFLLGLDPGQMYRRGDEHGTSCAGVAAAEVDGLLTVGAAPGCRLFPIRWETQSGQYFVSDSKFRTLLDTIADQVDILSNSWGASPQVNWSYSVIQRVKELAETGGRRGKGIVFCFAAGNENCPINHTGNQDIPYFHDPQTGRLLTSRYFSHNLSQVPGVLFVGALASTGQRAHYSNYGPGLDLMAPSSNLHTYGFMRVPGLGIVAAEGGSHLTDDFGGTSSACPLVAGIAALLISADPQLTALEIARILKETAGKELDTTPYPRRANHPAWDISPVYEDGSFQDTGEPEGSWSPWFGFGKVDAEAAMRRVLQAQAPAQPAEPAARISIGAALPNPVGGDRGREMVYLFNTGSAALELRAWSLYDAKNRRDEVPATTLEPGGALAIRLQKVRLPNDGGQLTLRDAEGRVVDSVVYTADQVVKGRLLSFVFPD